MDPQGRLVLQEYTIDRSRAFRSGTPPPCTVWPRTVMRGKSRKVNSGPNSVPKSARRTEPSSRAPPFRCTSPMCQRKGRSGESRGDRKPYLVSCPLLSLPGDPGNPPAVGTASPPGDPGNPPAVGTASPPPDGGSPRRRRRLFPSAVGTAFSPPPCGGNFMRNRQCAAAPPAW